MDTKLLVYHKYGNRANQVAQPSSANCVKEKLLYAMDSLLAHLDQGCKNQVTGACKSQPRFSTKTLCQSCTSNLGWRIYWESLNALPISRLKPLTYYRCEYPFQK